MNEPKPSWIRRHARAVFGLVAAMVVSAAGYMFVSAVNNAQTAARRMSDL